MLLPLLAELCETRLLEYGQQRVIVSDPWVLYALTVCGSLASKQFELQILDLDAVQVHEGSDLILTGSDARSSGTKILARTMRQCQIPLQMHAFCHAVIVKSRLSMLTQRG